ncbi:Hypothetical predicted protein [Octopus vulgaris]|uniref:Uncharacterized protein n=1 Tax=Octopus vulgaris TaxID=6645 RepID=A0AA36FC98_OCTVU|nr:Hypothetical predicted protein [Octopus vulgaris]
MGQKEDTTRRGDTSLINTLPIHNSQMVSTFWLRHDGGGGDGGAGGGDVVDMMEEVVTFVGGDDKTLVML